MAKVARLLLQASYRSAGRRLIWRGSSSLARARGRIEAFYGYRIPDTVKVKLRGRTLCLSGKAWNGVASGVWWGGLAGFEPAETQLVAALATRYKTVLDIGANIGWFSLVVASTNPSARIFAFEPNFEVAFLLRQNFLTNRVIGETLPLAVSDKCGRAVFYQDKDDWASSLVDHSSTARTLEVQSVTVDDFVLSNELEPDFLKIDVEGAEEEVFAGAHRTLRAFTPDLLFEVSPLVTSVERLRASLLSCGYQRFWTFASGRLIPDHEMQLVKGRQTINYFSSTRFDAGAPL